MRRRIYSYNEEDSVFVQTIAFTVQKRGRFIQVLFDTNQAVTLHLLREN